MDTDDWPYVIKEHDYSEQSPVDISTTNAQRRYLPFLRYFGYWAFNKAIVNITNNGHTGITNRTPFFGFIDLFHLSLFDLTVCVKLSNETDDVPFITGGPLFDFRYEFEQMHFHWGKDDFGSEHKLNGEK